MKFTYLLLLSFVINAVLAQSGSIEGRITNAEGIAVPFVSIQIPELQIGIESDEAGKFLFESILVGSYTLKVAFLGYKTLEKAIVVQDNKRINLSLELYENTELLKEIIIKEYSSQNKKIVAVTKLTVKPMDLPMAMQSIDKQTLENQQVLTMQDVLMNTNGVYIMGATGGYQEEIAARGFSLSSTNTFKNGARFLNNMMPELSSLERVEVLKVG